MTASSGRPAPWLPAPGDRVAVGRSGIVGTVIRIADTEWGVLCDVAYDAPPGAAAEGPPIQRVHAAHELTLLPPSA